jgi:hypothetical protein
LIFFFIILEKVVSEHNNKENNYNNNNTNMSGLSNARKIYRMKVAAAKANKTKASATNVADTKIQNCRYCKEDGHVVGFYDKKTQSFKEVCPALAEKKKRSAEAKKTYKQKKKMWQTQMSEAVSFEHGEGWATKGSSISHPRTVTHTTRVVEKVKNRFELGDGFGEDEKDDPHASDATCVWANVAPGVYDDTLVTPLKDVGKEETKCEDRPLLKVLKYIREVRGDCGDCGEWGCESCKKNKGGVSSSDGW